LTDDELVESVTHDLRALLAVIAGYCELVLTRDDPALRAEATAAVDTAVAELADDLDEVMLALELAWESWARTETVSLDLRRAAEEVVERRPARWRASMAPGDVEVWALGDSETVWRTLQALLRAAGPDAVVHLGTGVKTVTVAIEAAAPVRLEELRLRNARRLADLLLGSVRVEGARLELELPAG
jgi:signal transduction histidine kinase